MRLALHSGGFDVVEVSSVLKINGPISLSSSLFTIARWFYRLNSLFQIILKPLPLLTLRRIEILKYILFGTPCFQNSESNCQERSLFAPVE